VLRIDVDRAPGNPLSANGQYAIPLDNPFVGRGGGVVEEIHAFGFRNPWRLGFDPLTGELHVADVGESDIEEIDRVDAGGNYGWPFREGSFVALPTGGVTDVFFSLSSRFLDPAAQYDHGQAHRSATGGFVYRGSLYPALAGDYVFGDWISGRLLHVDAASGQIQEVALDPDGAQIDGQQNGGIEEGIISFGQAASGELYIVVTQRNLSETGRILRFVSTAQ